MSKGDLPFGILVPWIDVLCFHLPSDNEFAPCLWQKKAFAGRRRAKVRAQCKWRGRPKPASPLLEAEPVIRTCNVDSVTYRNLAQKRIQFKLDMIGNISFVPESEQKKKDRADCGSWIVDREEGDEPFGVCCQGFENVPL
jgi:hypothetical protein